MSPYSRSLIHLMQSAPREVERAKAEVLLGCYWARVGEMAAAEEIRQRSRARYPSGENGAITVMHMCLDGLMNFYSEQSPAAAERLRSAHVLASTYKFRDEQAFSAAWLAHVEFNRDHWEATFDALASCRAALDPSDKGVEGRLSLVVADSLLHAGEPSFSRAWYEHARRLFTSIGDHAAIEAFLYNGAALRIHAARLRSISEQVSADELELLGGDIDAATNYQRITNQRSLDYLLDAARSAHRILRQDFPAAGAIIERLLESGEIPKASHAPAVLLADLALCRARLDDRAGTLAALDRASAAMTDDLAADDAAVAANSMALACDAIDLQQASQRWQERRDESLQSFGSSRRRLRTLLSPWMTTPRLALDPSS